jgi:hypothetical protein
LFFAPLHFLSFWPVSASPHLLLFFFSFFSPLKSSFSFGHICVDDYNLDKGYQVDTRNYTRLLFLLRRSPPLPRRPPPRSSKNLALDTSSRDSFHSCPDLSLLQITPVPADFDSPGVRTDPSRSPSPSSEPAPHKKRSKTKSVSRKARGVIGKVRAFQRIAAARMAHPTIKIDTSVPAIKRGLPENDDAGLDVLSADQDNPKLEAGNTEDVPPFLCQTVSGK